MEPSEYRARAEELSALTNAFYGRIHRSFSATRRAPWRGWDELWSLVGAEVEAAAFPAASDTPALPATIADVACGNLRFARFLQQNMSVPFTVFGYDDCEPLLREGLVACAEAGVPESAVRARPVDIAAALAEGTDPFEGLPPCVLSVAFGFMHHLPTGEQRRALLERMVQHAAPGGFVAVSFWRFADDERLRAKAEEATQRARVAGIVADLPGGDYVLGWQDDGEALRYCHHFTEGEIDDLSMALEASASEVARFSADGKSGTLNRYAVWRRNGRE